MPKSLSPLVAGSSCPPTQANPSFPPGMQENSLHRSLKNYFAGDSGQQEVWVDGYWIDVVHEELLIEVQTRSFSSIKNKLFVLMQNHPLILVHPIPVEKWIIRNTAGGEERISRRKSPRQGRIEHVFNELIRFPEYISHPNFSICLVFTQEEEIRCLDGRGSWRRKGASISDRKLLKILSTRMLASPNDFQALLPVSLGQTFTNQELAKALGIRPALARKMTYCLRKMNVLEVDGKRQRELLYKVLQPTYNLLPIDTLGENHEQ